MATKKKTKKKQASSKKTVGQRARSAKRLARDKRRIAKKKSVNRPTQNKRARVKAGSKKAINRKAVNAPTKHPQQKSQSVDMVSLRREGRRSRSGGQSGDLQGLSNIAGADSESVDELLEEGNAFEADAVKGVEDAGDLDEREVRTHEVAEDDVPEEYLEEK